MTYPGGKNGAGVYQQIINRIPPHDVYIEPFLGSGAILRMKRPAKSSIGIDRDMTVIRSFPEAAVPNLTLLNRNAIAWLSMNKFQPTTFIYIDPPYLFETRKKPFRIYLHELRFSDHERLLGVISGLSCMVMISGYPNALYDDTLSCWHTATFMTTNRGGGHVTEKLWMNYPTPTRLHDYRYLGRDFRERERIKRKIQRWIRRLSTMPDLERYALTAAIDTMGDAVHHRRDRRTVPAAFDQRNDSTCRIDMSDEGGPHRLKERFPRLTVNSAMPSRDDNLVSSPDLKRGDEPDPIDGLGDAGSDVAGFGDPDGSISMARVASHRDSSCSIDDAGVGVPPGQPSPSRSPYPFPEIGDRQSTEMPILDERCN